MKLRVALAQLEPVSGAPTKNLSKIKDVVDTVAADLYVFPELFLLGYYSKDLIYKYAMPLSSPVIDSLKMMAREKRVGIVVGFPEKTDYGFVYNSALAVNERGELYVYRKRHLPTFSVFDEHRWFRPYRGMIKPWSFRGIRVGIAICYDVFFPEIFKAYTVMGAKLLIAISASPDSSVPLFHILTRARALENTSFFVWVNMVGFFDGVGFGGSSLAVDPLGNVIVQLRQFEEDIQVVELDFNSLDSHRTIRPVLRDSYIEDAELLLQSYKVLENLP